MTLYVKNCLGFLLPSRINSLYFSELKISPKDVVEKKQTNISGPAIIQVIVTVM
jgi:hypothetical protein